MRHILVILAFVFSLPMASKSQTTDDEQYRRERYIYIPWTQQYNPMNCQPSFKWSVSQSDYRNNSGQSLFKIYFKSTSLYCNGMWGGTYMNGMQLYINGVLTNPYNKYWISFKDTYEPKFFEFWSYDKPKIYFTWDYITVN